ncbi:MAG TPA: OmpA family protein [Bryobacteraceae bacterium]|nr:OmpA family protein [Bryobacteraceae bacterium]
MTTSKVQAMLATAAIVSLGSWGCATKKHVREAIAPVQQQVNDVQKQTSDNKTAIGDLDRQVATADEKATDAGRRASDAAKAAADANTAAQEAQQRADSANTLAQQVNSRADHLEQNFANLDNYTLVNTQQVFFKVGQSVLTKDAKDQLDTAIANMSNPHNIIIEVEGFTDRTGSKSYNLELARRRADAVVRYLTVEKNIPLREIRQLGVGSDFPNAANKTRAERKENRRVDVKVYALNLSGTAGASASSDANRTNSGASDRTRTPVPDQK